MGLWCPVCSVDPAPPSPTLRTSFEQSCAPDRPCLALGFVWCALEPRDPGSVPHDLPATLLSAPSCFGRIGDGTYLILGPSPPIDGKERAGSLSLLLASQPGWVCQYSANRYLVTENTLVCVWGGAGGVLWDFPRDTCQQAHHSDLLCTGLPLSTFTPSRDNARPEGTWGPSHRDSRASICGFLLLLQELNRPVDAPAESSLQAAALSSPAVSVHHPTGPGLYGRLQQVCGENQQVLDLGRSIWPHEPSWHPVCC